MVNAWFGSLSAEGIEEAGKGARPGEHRGRRNEHDVIRKAQVVSESETSVTCKGYISYDSREALRQLDRHNEGDSEAMVYRKELDEVSEWAYMAHARAWKHGHMRPLCALHCTPASTKCNLGWAQNKRD
ncbi:hypothetical protein AMTR_s00177p00029720 [Amborella trichopoda]|uniref:Uncharacterized protein n=1 Tax=Amborella trichopoda TaxID=13333 RepID=W1PJY5_AMBTC|nr:hypothetical protein AMTR_s00177p00029720 [Amborella trichopoda]